MSRKLLVSRKLLSCVAPGAVARWDLRPLTLPLPRPAAMAWSNMSC